MSSNVCAATAGGRSHTVHGFLYREGDAYAVYHALLQREHPSTVVDLALTFGSWDEEATASDRTRVGIRTWPDEDELKLHIATVEECLLGRLGDFRTVADRSDVLGTPTERDAMLAAEFVVAQDGGFASTFASHRSGDIPEHWGRRGVVSRVVPWKRLIAYSGQCGVARRRAQSTGRALPTGARSTVQPTANRQSVERRARTRRLREASCVNARRSIESIVRGARKARCPRVTFPSTGAIYRCLASGSTAGSQR